MMSEKYPMEEIEAALDVADIARDLVALWENQNIKGLPRADRNAAIDDTRKKLIEAVKIWGAALKPDDPATSVTREQEMKKLYLGAMNDGLFIIDQPPRPSTDDISPDRDVAVFAKLTDNSRETQAIAERMLAAYNATL